MSSISPSELRKQLIAAGLEIFRVKGNRVHLADRVRENLIMDGGVYVVAQDPIAVRIVIRAQASHFPGESPDQLFGRARTLGAATEPHGYAEVESSVVPINDPGGGPTTLDTWYEVTFEKTVEPQALLPELRFALGVEKAATAG